MKTRFAGWLGAESTHDCHIIATHTSVIVAAVTPAEDASGLAVTCRGWRGVGSEVAVRAKVQMRRLGCHHRAPG